MKVTSKEMEKIYEELKAEDPANSRCADCNSLNPAWASTSFGIFLCLICTGAHRAIGVHVSFVRSITMDNWDPEHVERMRKGGNTKWKTFAAEQNISSKPIREKYMTLAATYYREMLTSLTTERPMPPALTGDATQADPKLVSKTISSQGSASTEAPYAPHGTPVGSTSEADIFTRIGSMGATAMEKMQSVNADSVAAFANTATEKLGHGIDSVTTTVQEGRVIESVTGAFERGATLTASAAAATVAKLSDDDFWSGAQDSMYKTGAAVSESVTKGLGAATGFLQSFFDNAPPNQPSASSNSSFRGGAGGPSYGGVGPASSTSGTRGAAENISRP